MNFGVAKCMQEVVYSNNYRHRISNYRGKRSRRHGVWFSENVSSSALWQARWKTEHWALLLEGELRKQTNNNNKPKQTEQTNKKRCCEFQQTNSMPLSWILPAVLVTSSFKRYSGTRSINGCLTEMIWVTPVWGKSEDTEQKIIQRQNWKTFIKLWNLNGYGHST